ncbi:MAG: ethanolamine ammonia-lyase subunit EutC [Bacillota bacterium]|nr:ethanolamine ammonia-lyase subunit EutC [Bacillota bacterium]
MNPELVETITKLIVEKLQTVYHLSDEADDTAKLLPESVKLWNTKSHDENGKNHGFTFEHASERKEDSDQLVKFSDYTSAPNVTEQKEKAESKKSPVQCEEQMVQDGIEQPFNQEELESLISKTPARIGVGRAGLRPKTSTWLKFRYDHAAAVDAVYGNVNEELLKSLDLFKVNTLVTEKEVYIRRPDMGRKLSDEAKNMISSKCVKSPTVQIVVSDGLSSKAIDANLEDVFLSLQQSLKSIGLDVGTPFFIEKGRVAVMDDIGELLRPKIVVLLIGERPGLVSAESLSAYLCYEPRIGTIEADRMVISNIHKGGIPPVEAGAYLGTIIQKVLKYEASGVSLVQKEG